MKVDVPIAEVVDKLAILAIKAELLPTELARANAVREADALGRAWHDAGLPPIDQLPQGSRLRDVNQALWDVEDALRGHEARQDFGPDFVALARSVYRLNDDRAALKRAINLELGSALLEEKSYGARAADRA